MSMASARSPVRLAVIPLLFLSGLPSRLTLFESAP